MVNLVTEVRRAMTLKDELYHDKPRYGLIEIMREERPILVKREGLGLPGIAGEILPAEQGLLKEKSSLFKVAIKTEYDYCDYTKRHAAIIKKNYPMLRLLDSVSYSPRMSEKVIYFDGDSVSYIAAAIRQRSGYVSFSKLFSDVPDFEKGWNTKAAFDSVLWDLGFMSMTTFKIKQKAIDLELFKKKGRGYEISRGLFSVILMIMYLNTFPETTGLSRPYK